MEIYTKISEEKYPKVSVATIGKLQENTRALCKMAAKFSHKRLICSRAKIFLQLGVICLAMAVTPSFKLRIAFLFASPPCIPDLLMAKDFKAFEKQPIVTLSTIEAEFVATLVCACQGVWMKKNFKGVGTS
ncbi:hypothetical protein CK203_039678 [Vitis vinifera]|uniref:Uncharacterized protein n=1 Tax=Vitis vinifera TaxID=29760 RepID=A0A438HFJ7_VITVI|nr:hypothetical protein CK203_039678 [Vitis vinifera]